MIKISTNVLGTFALKERQVVKKILFKRSDTKGIAKKLLQIEEGSFCEEEGELIRQLGEKEIEVEKPSRFLNYGQGVKFKLDQKKNFPRALEIGLQLGMKKEDILELNRKVNLELSKIKLKIYQPDKILIQVINALDELEDVVNLLVEHLRDLHSLNFPELSSLFKEPREYVEAIVSQDDKRIEEVKKRSIGMDFSTRDKESVQELAKGILGLYNVKDHLEEQIEESARKIAPNTTELIGSLLTARLISRAGSLRKLAFMPSSTVQILGAEKAFFSFLKRKEKPPKHGIIFQFPEIRSAKREIRGKLSRTLAAKIAIATKTDFYEGKFIGDKLKKKFSERVERLKGR